MFYDRWTNEIGGPVQYRMLYGKLVGFEKGLQKCKDGNKECVKVAED